ncbi:MAG: hypothetical protein ABFD18_20405 [Syntrophomonas sp.]
MATQICAEQVATITTSYAATITCGSLTHTPVGPGSECRMSLYNVNLNTGSSPMTLSFSFNSQFEYQWLDHGVTFMDFAESNGDSGSVTLDSNLGLCGCGLTPTYVYSFTCNAAAITTTATMVQGPVSLSFTITNLCTPTLICVDTVPCA